MAIFREWGPIALAGVLAATGLPATSAIACSVVEGYRVPTNLELAAAAEVVALVEVVSGPADYGADDPFSAKVKVRALKFLKGRAADADLSLVGVIGWNGKSVAPVVTPLGEAHFSVGLGSCIRAFYRPGSSLLAFYERSDGRLHQIGAPFSRAVEDVAGPDDLWVRAAMRYVALAAGDAQQMEVRARAERDALLATPGVEAAAIAQDLDRYLVRMKPRRTGWFTASGPLDSVAMVRDGQVRDRWAGVYCGGRNRFGMLAPKGAQSITLVVDGKALAVADKAAMATDPGDTPVPPSDTAFFAFIDRAGALSALTKETEVVATLDGRPIAPTPPGDALYRLAQRCAAFE